MSSQSDQTKQIFTAVFKRIFADVEIDSIDIHEDVDFDGDEFLRVTVVFETSEPLDASAVLEFGRVVRSELESINERRLPVMSFVDRDDEGRIAETA